jgi:hypothetical protein
MRTCPITADDLRIFIVADLLRCMLVYKHWLAYIPGDSLTLRDILFLETEQPLSNEHVSVSVFYFTGKDGLNFFPSPGSTMVVPPDFVSPELRTNPILLKYDWNRVHSPEMKKVDQVDESTIYRLHFRMHSCST